MTNIFSLSGSGNPTISSLKIGPIRNPSSTAPTNPIRITTFYDTSTSVTDSTVGLASQNSLIITAIPGISNNVLAVKCDDPTVAAATNYEFRINTILNPLPILSTIEI